MDMNTISIPLSRSSPSPAEGVNVWWLKCAESTKGATKKMTFAQALDEETIFWLEGRHVQRQGSWECKMDLGNYKTFHMHPVFLSSQKLLGNKMSANIRLCKPGLKKKKKAFTCKETGSHERIVSNISEWHLHLLKFLFGRNMDDWQGPEWRQR